MSRNRIPSPASLCSVRALIAGVALAACVLPASDLHAESGAGQPWIPLFDGKSTKGWTPRSEVIRFEAKDGELQLESKTNCWVTTDIKADNFVVECEVKLPEDAAEVGFNSGLAFRCTGEKGKPTGYQVEIDLSKSGGVFGIGLGGWLYPAKDDQAAFAQRTRNLFRPDNWNHVKVVAEGPRVRTYLNGVQVADLEDSQSLKGYFGIQHHGKGGTVRFRNLRLRRLAPNELTAAATTSPAPAQKPASKKAPAKQPAPKKALKGKDPAKTKPAPGRPNILWITCEDMSPTLGCYGDPYATTPHLDAFAKESVRYTHAFASSPVCSPSRSTLITGLHSASMGTNQMRSAFPLPTGVKGFPSYLRKAGYYTSNNVKTDYNTGDADRLIKESWDLSSPQAHWRDRKAKDQPFFSVFNLMVSHQSRTMVWPYPAFQKHVQASVPAGKRHDPAKAPVPPYYPDTPVVRKTIARYYDCVTAMDQEVGRLLDELEKDGLADDTIVFFYSDHGSGMPRHKRNLHDSGMQVALMIRFPEKYRHLAPSAPGSVSDQLVSFVDFAPTTLRLAGVKAQGYFQGKPFLGPGEITERRYVYGTRDRVDEVFDTARSIRDHRYLYIRNFRPDQSWCAPSVFSDLGEIRQDITRLARHDPGALDQAQLAFAGPNRPIEEFYDCVADPHQINNLLDDPTALTDLQADSLHRLRTEFRHRRLALGDVGALPEAVMWDWVRDEKAPMRDIVLGKTKRRPDLAAAWRAADRVGTASDDELLAALGSDAVDRYWAVIGLRDAGFGNAVFHRIVAGHLGDPSAPVRLEAASWLGWQPTWRGPAFRTLSAGIQHEDWWTALLACRGIELLGPEASPLLPNMRRLHARTRGKPGDENFFLAFSSSAFLDTLGDEVPTWDFSPGAGSFSADPKEDKK